MPYYPSVPFTLDTNPNDIQADGMTAVAGASGLAADAKHIHPSLKFLGQMAVPGPLPVSMSITKTIAASRLWITGGGTAIKINAIGQAILGLNIDGVLKNNFWTYSNTFATNNHLAMPGISFVYTGVAAGAHTISINSQDANTSSDANDDYFLVVYEQQDNP